MTIAEWCLFGAVLLYLLTLAPVKALSSGDFDNADPRNPAFYDNPVRRRALGAHINGIETFPFLGAAILLAEFRHAPQPWIDGLAAAFLVTRIAFVLAYIANRATLRSVLWNAAMAFNIGLFFLSGYGVRGAIIASAIGLAWALTLWPLTTWLARRAERTRI